MRAGGLRRAGRDFRVYRTGKPAGVCDFIQKVAGRLESEGYIVVTALAPKTSGDQPSAV